MKRLKTLGIENEKISHTYHIVVYLHHHQHNLHQQRNFHQQQSHVTLVPVLMEGQLLVTMVLLVMEIPAMMIPVKWMVEVKVNAVAVVMMMMIPVMKSAQTLYLSKPSEYPCWCKQTYPHLVQVHCTVNWKEDRKTVFTIPSLLTRKQSLFVFFLCCPGMKPPNTNKLSSSSIIHLWWTSCRHESECWGVELWSTLLDWLQCCESVNYRLIYMVNYR